jgi:hypothetical protein
MLAQLPIEEMKEYKGFRMVIHARLLSALVLALVPAVAVSQSTSNSGATWTSSYAFPSPSERTTRLQYMDTQRRLETGYYNPSAYSNAVNNYYDHSVGETTITAAEGAHVQIDNRTGMNSGTNTNTVGSINTTTSTITVDGKGNAIDISASSTNTGCHDGSVNMAMNQLFETIDISAGASGALAATTSRDPGGCND